MPLSNAKGKRCRRTHSLGGCGTCRKRHVKCDQVRPACLNCQAVGAHCEGFDRSLQWVDAHDADLSVLDGSDISNKRVRNHLYTEQTRASMSTALRTELGSKSVDDSLLELETQYGKTTSTSNTSHSVGPFGVFSLAISMESTSEAEPRGTLAQHISSNEAIDTSPTTEESTEPTAGLSEWLDWPDLFELDFAFPEVFARHFEDTPVLVPPLSIQNPTSMPTNMPKMLRPNDPNSKHETEIGSVLIKSTSTPNFGVQFCALNSDEIHVLLKHFQDHVIPHIMSLPLIETSTWEMLGVSSAILTLARLTFMAPHHVTSAALANLLAICAMSAKHLATQLHPADEPKAIYWDNLAERLIGPAKEEMQLSLTNEFHGRNVAKYKDQLMALACLSSFSILYDRQEDAHAYMVEAERLVRLRGLAKRNISRKARLLHHIYTWVRILGESTYVLRDYSHCELNTAIGMKTNPRKRRRVDQSHDATAADPTEPISNTRLDDFLRLQQNHTSMHNNDPRNRKNQELGLHDIHLEDSRVWLENLYMDLYGVSETWLCLVSQTTRLANVLDCLAAGRERKNVEVLDFLEKRKNGLENLVCAAAAGIDGNGGTNSEPAKAHSHDQKSPTTYMVEALNSALVIYFYRRIRNVNPWILQEHVTNVIKALKAFDASCEAHKIDVPGSPWPAFMAGCEAISKGQREYFSHWFDSAMRLTGFTRLKSACNCMFEVWKHRDAAMYDGDKHGADLPFSWVQYSKQKKLWVLLS